MIVFLSVSKVVSDFIPWTVFNALIFLTTLSLVCDFIASEIILVLSYKLVVEAVLYWNAVAKSFEDLEVLILLAIPWYGLQGIGYRPTALLSTTSMPLLPGEYPRPEWIKSLAILVGDPEEFY